MDDISLTDLSRVLSHALRHEPWIYELELDDEGWAKTDELLEHFRGLRPEWSGLSEVHLEAMIQSSQKVRHELRSGAIRALYGHSLPGRLARTAAAPPDVLFHGTSPKAVPRIQESGLLPMKRQYVHLSKDQATALEVGRRKAREPAILRIAAVAAYANGVRFYVGNENVWLADAVPPTYVEFESE